MIKGVLKKSKNSRVWLGSLFLKKLQQTSGLKLCHKRYRCFPVNFAKFLRTSAGGSFLEQEMYSVEVKRYLKIVFGPDQT